MTCGVSNCFFVGRILVVTRSEFSPQCVRPVRVFNTRVNLRRHARARRGRSPPARLASGDARGRALSASRRRRLRLGKAATFRFVADLRTSRSPIRSTDYVVPAVDLCGSDAAAAVPVLRSLCAKPQRRTRGVQPLCGAPSGTVLCRRVVPAVPVLGRRIGPHTCVVALRLRSSCN